MPITFSFKTYFYLSRRERLDLYLRQSEILEVHSYQSKLPPKGNFELVTSVTEQNYYRCIFSIQDAYKEEALSRVMVFMCNTGTKMISRALKVVAVLRHKPSLNKWGKSRQTLILLANKLVVLFIIRLLCWNLGTGDDHITCACFPRSNELTEVIATVLAKFSKQYCRRKSICTFILKGRKV